MSAPAGEQRLLRAALEGGLDGMVVVSSDGTMIAMNHQFQAMWPIPADVVASGSDEPALGSVLDKLVDPDAFLLRVQELYADPRGTSRQGTAGSWSATSTTSSRPVRRRPAGRPAGLPDDLSASGIAAAVERAALDFGGHEPSDDTAVLVVRVPVAV